ncbi:hypothetical protein KQI65_16020 [bacterium]|nr:hypothetical protein [bacterium]
MTETDSLHQRQELGHSLGDFALLTMRSIPSVEVAMHRKRNPHMVLNDPACHWAWLQPEQREDRIVFRLDLHAGDSITQAKALYRELVLDKLLALSRKEEWTVVPNVRFSFMSTGLHESYPVMGLKLYAQFWIQHAEFIKKVHRGVGDFGGITDWLREAAFISDDDVRELHRLFHDSKRDHMHFFPRLSLYRRWPVAEQMRGMGEQAFAQEVYGALSDAQDCWSQSNPHNLSHAGVQ